MTSALRPLNELILQKRALGTLKKTNPRCHELLENYARASSAAIGSTSPSSVESRNSIDRCGKVSLPVAEAACRTKK